MASLIAAELGFNLSALNELRKGFFPSEYCLFCYKS